MSNTVGFFLRAAMPFAALLALAGTSSAQGQCRNGSMRVPQISQQFNFGYQRPVGQFNYSYQRQGGGGEQNNLTNFYLQQQQMNQLQAQFLQQQAAQLNALWWQQQQQQLLQQNALAALLLQQQQQNALRQGFVQPQVIQAAQLRAAGLFPLR